jgi:hypothetical protein
MVAVRAVAFGSDYADRESAAQAAEQHRVSGLNNGGDDRGAGHQKSTDDLERSKHDSHPPLTILRVSNRN